MADVRGRDAKIAVSAAGSVYTDLAGAKDVTFSVDQSTVDVTDFVSGSWTEHLVGRKTVTISITANYDEADAGIAIVEASWQGGTQIYFRYRPMGDASGVSDELIAKGTITSLEDASPNEDATEVSIEAQVTGAVTAQQQP